MTAKHEVRLAGFSNHDPGNEHTLAYFTVDEIAEALLNGVTAMQMRELIPALKRVSERRARILLWTELLTYARDQGGGWEQMFLVYNRHELVGDKPGEGKVGWATTRQGAIAKLRGLADAWAER